MYRTVRTTAISPPLWLALLALVGAGAELAAQRLPAQVPGVEAMRHDVMNPGAIGSWQLQRGGPLPGYYQPVEIKAPPGAAIAMVDQGDFEDPLPAPTKVGLLIAPVYRLRVTNIPNQEGLEVFPTIEVINRLYPPRGQEWRFSIPIELTQEDLELALDGKLVTRVIFLEEPRNALPARHDPAHQSWFDAGPGESPLRIADSLGRPVAILRMGGRLPDDRDGSDPAFTGTCPPWIRPAPPSEFIEYQTRRRTGGEPSQR